MEALMVGEFQLMGSYLNPAKGLRVWSYIPPIIRTGRIFKLALHVDELVQVLRQFKLARLAKSRQGSGDVLLNRLVVRSGYDSPA